MTFQNIYIIYDLANNMVFGAFLDQQDAIDKYNDYADTNEFETVIILETENGVLVDFPFEDKSTVLIDNVPFIKGIPKQKRIVAIDDSKDKSDVYDKIDTDNSKYEVTVEETNAPTNASSIDDNHSEIDENTKKILEKIDKKIDEKLNSHFLLTNYFRESEYRNIDKTLMTDLNRLSAAFDLDDLDAINLMLPKIPAICKCSDNYDKENGERLTNIIHNISSHHTICYLSGESVHGHLIFDYIINEYTPLHYLSECHEINPDRLERLYEKYRQYNRKIYNVHATVLVNDFNDDIFDVLMKFSDIFAEDTKNILTYMTMVDSGKDKLSIKTIIDRCERLHKAGFKFDTKYFTNILRPGRATLLKKIISWGYEPTADALKEAKSKKTLASHYKIMIGK